MFDPAQTIADEVFLVLVRHHWDDVPVRVFRTRAEAEQFLLEYDPFEPVPAALNIDCSTPMFVDLITYRDAVPVSHDRITTVAEDGWED